MLNEEIIESVRSKQFLLVVDSNARDAGATGLLLQQFGYRVVTLQTARQAQEILGVVLPILIVTELLLHEVTGLELIHQLRSDPRTKSLPVVVLTRVNDQKSEDRCRAAGCTAYLRKPATYEQFYEIVQAAVEPTPRRNIRIGLRFPVTVAGPDAPPEPSVATELSVEGMYLRTASAYPAGSRVSLAFRLRGRPMVLEAEVRYRKGADLSDPDAPGMGVRFVRIGERDHDWIALTIREVVQSGLAFELEEGGGSGQG